MRDYRTGIDELGRAETHLKNASSCLSRFSSLCGTDESVWTEEVSALLGFVSRAKDEAERIAVQRENAVYGCGIIRPTFISRENRKCHLIVHRPCADRPSPYIEESSLRALAVMIGEGPYTVNAPFEVDVYEGGRKTGEIPGMKPRI